MPRLERDDDLLVNCPTCGETTYSGLSGRGDLNITDARATCPAGHEIAFSTHETFYAGPVADPAAIIEELFDLPAGTVPRCATVSHYDYARLEHAVTIQRIRDAADRVAAGLTAELQCGGNRTAVVFDTRPRP